MKFSLHKEEKPWKFSRIDVVEVCSVANRDMRSGSFTVNMFAQKDSIFHDFPDVYNV